MEYILPLRITSLPSRQSRDPAIRYSLSFRVFRTGYVYYLLKLSLMILWINISNFQPPKEADNASPCLESVSVQASKDFDHRVPSKLIIPDIFCGSSKPNGHLPQNGSGSTSSSTRSGRSGLSADPHFNERRHSESVVKSRNSQAGAYLFCAA